MLHVILSLIGLHSCFGISWQSTGSCSLLLFLTCLDCSFMFPLYPPHLQAHLLCLKLSLNSRILPIEKLRNVAACFIWGGVVCVHFPNLVLWLPDGCVPVLVWIGHYHTSRVNNVLLSFYFILKILQPYSEDDVVLIYVRMSYWKDGNVSLLVGQSTTFG